MRRNAIFDRLLLALAIVATATAAYLYGSAGSTILAIPMPSSLAPKVEFRCPPSGAVYQLDSFHTTMTSLGKHDFECRFQTEAEHGTEWFGGMVPGMDPEDTSGRETLRKLWPMRVGEHFAWQYTDTEGRLTENSLSVRGYELLHVPAGWFYVFRVDHTCTKPHYTYTITHWWSPALSLNIKQSYQQSYADGLSRPLPIGILWNLAKFSNPR